MKILITRLAAPLQSYGTEASFDQRISNRYPTKSAIIGMVASALGYSRDDSRISKLNNLKFGVRIEQPGKMNIDYQVITEKTKETYRYYLQDAVYLIALGSDDAYFIDKIEYALKHPRNALFLGRRSYPLSGVLKIEKYTQDDLITLLKRYPWQASTWYKKQYRNSTFKTRIISDAPVIGANSNFFVKDYVESFSPKDRRHTFREIAVENIELKNNISG